MIWKIIKLTFVFFILCFPASAIEVDINGITGIKVNNGQVQTSDEIKINKGEDYTLTLSETPSSGYKWEVTFSNGLKMLSDNFKPLGPGLRSEGVRELKFNAYQKGNQVIKAEYRKPSEEKPIETSIITLKVI